jgi:hypothetical protein
VRRRRVGRSIGVVAACLLAAVAGAAVLIHVLSTVRLSGDRVALARVRLGVLAGSIVSIRAATRDGGDVPLAVDRGLLVPRMTLDPGEQIVVTVTVRRPRWLSWVVGSERRVPLTSTTPVAHVLRRWLTVAHGPPRLRFDRPVSTVAIGGRRLAVSSRTVTLRTRAEAGSVIVAAAAEPWERLGRPVRVAWFPRADRPVVLARPAAGGQINPRTRLRLIFSTPVSKIVPPGHPMLVPPAQGRWVQEDVHTLEFRPAGAGAPFATVITIRLPISVRVAGERAPTRSLSWRVAPASFLRLQQLLAQEGYLPLTWSPAGSDVDRRERAQLAAATTPPPGRFRRRYAHTPHEIVSLWRTGKPNQITRGAVMRFEHDHGLAVDGIAGRRVWHAAIADAIDGRHTSAGYSYVYVHRALPQLLTLWHDGHVILTSPGNTGVPAAPTQLGTWPVFEHIPIGRMSGTNPDGSHYDDPGIRWISYFHGGEALHAFNRASFGTPQSLGCVELPLATAAKLWPYTPIGTLVTIEN